MVYHKCKSICGYGSHCGKRGNWRAQNANGSMAYACSDHKHKLEGKRDPYEDNVHMTEADYQIQHQFGI